MSCIAQTFFATTVDDIPISLRNFAGCEYCFCFRHRGRAGAREAAAGCRRLRSPLRPGSLRPRLNHRVFMLCLPGAASSGPRSPEVAVVPGICLPRGWRKASAGDRWRPPPVGGAQGGGGGPDGGASRGRGEHVIHLLPPSARRPPSARPPLMAAGVRHQVRLLAVLRVRVGGARWAS